jgi:hypothetical protein
VSDDRVVPFKRSASQPGRPVSGRLTFANSQLFIPVTRTSFGPRWAVKDGQIELSDGSFAPISVSLVAETVNDAGEMGYLDREHDGFAGELAVGTDYAQLLRHAAFSPVPHQFTVDVSVTAGGEVVELKLGLERTA